MSKRNTALALSAIRELRGKNCKVNLSELTNEIMAIFFEKHFKGALKHFEKRFFDRKKYLKKLIQSEAGENLDKSLKDYLKKVPITQKKEIKLDDSES